MRQSCEVRRPGLMEYSEAWSLQRHLHAAVQSEGVPQQCILLQHPHTYTLGRGGHDEFLLADEALLDRIGARVHRIDRGGDITYHGPGQLVGYPILNLRTLWGEVDAPRYVHGLERVLINVLADYGIAGGVREGMPGVWVGRDKIAAIGVRVSKGVTMHGFALNVTTDLSYFDFIVPCGIRDGGVTSMERLLGAAPAFDSVTDRVESALLRAFDLEPLAMAAAV